MPQHDAQQTLQESQRALLPHELQMTPTGANNSIVGNDNPDLVRDVARSAAHSGSLRPPLNSQNSTGTQEERHTWDKKVDFLLSVIGFSVDLGNVWRFPYLCYKNGGGAFLIPYLMMYFIGGIPLFFMELALGQFNRRGAITTWRRICPLFRGVGIAVVLIAFYVDFYYNMIIAWTLYFFFASFTSKLPWTACGNSWNTPNCYDFFAHSNVSNVTLNDTKRSSPAKEYFERGMLEIHKSQGLEAPGEVRWQLVLCLMAVYLICYFSLWKGISTSGKVVWFTAIFPYVVLFILLGRGVSLPGSADGIEFYLKPNFTTLATSEVWIDAATQVFFSLGPGFGVLLAFASYNPFHNNVYRDAWATSIINCATSFLAGFVIFSVLGYMSFKTKLPIKEVATEGPGLVFVVYPEAIARLPGSTFWSIIFFLMLLTLGLDSSFGGTESVITGLSDEFPIIRRKREIFVAALFSLYFIVGLYSCTQGGAYFVYLLDNYAASYSILIAVLFESVCIGWFYGIDRFSADIKEMMGFHPSHYWKVCWKYLAPIFLTFNITFGLIGWKPLAYDDGYVYTPWANAFGWTLAISSVIFIPLGAIYQMYLSEGSLTERFRQAKLPWREEMKARILALHNEPLHDLDISARTETFNLYPRNEAEPAKSAADPKPAAHLHNASGPPPYFSMFPNDKMSRIPVEV